MALLFSFFFFVHVYCTINIMFKSLMPRKMYILGNKKYEMNLNVISMYFWAIARIHRIAFYLRGIFPTTSDKYVIWYLINWCVTCDLESVFCCPSLLLDLIYWQESNWRRCQTKDLVLLYIFKIHGCEMEKIALVHYMDNTLKKIKD